MGQQVWYFVKYFVGEVSWPAPLWSRLGEKDICPLLEKITVRINLWQAKLLSFIGRFLIKLVLLSFCIYWLSAFVLPKGILCKINVLVFKFLWEGSSVEGSLYIASIKKVCKHKE